MRYAMNSLLLRSYGTFITPIFNFNGGRIEKLEEHTYDLVMRRDMDGKSRIYPFDLGINGRTGGEILSYMIDPHDSGLVRYRLRESQVGDLMDRLRKKLHQ